MRLDRAAKFGLFGSVGFVVISLGIFAMVREVQRGVKRGTLEADVTILMILIGGTTVGLIFLFVLVGEYVDRELESRGLANSRD